MTDPALWNHPMETLNPAGLRDLQARLLRKQLQYVDSHSPFYQRKWSHAGASPAAVSQPGDLSRLPFTTKAELRQSQVQQPPLGAHACADGRQVIRIHSSTGTTGRPVYVGLTLHDRAAWTEMVARCMYAAGIRTDSVIIYALSIGLFIGGFANQDAIESIGATFIPVGVGHTGRLIACIRHLEANALTCTPSYAAYLAFQIQERHGIDPRDLSVRTLIVGGEPGGGSPGTRRLLEEAWQARVYDAMGNADIAPIFLGECSHQTGMHFMGQEFLLPEVIDPDSGESLPLEGEVSGELVVTHLDRECVPLVRFRTGDRVELDCRPCPCGRTSFRLRCEGRTDDLIMVRGVRVFPAAVKDLVASLRPRTTGEILIELDRSGPRAEPPLRVLVERGAAAGSPDHFQQEVEQLLREKLLFRAQVELVPAGSLPRYEMKARLVRVRGR